MKKLLFLFIFFSAVGAWLLLKTTPDYSSYQVIAVTDGDTIKVKSLNPLKKAEVWEIRYLGIDTPELGKGDKKDDCYALEAKKINENLVLGQKVKLEFDKNKIDRFGRYLAYVYLKTNKEIMINQTLLKKGAGRFFLDTVNTKYQEQLISSANQAHQEKKGLWQACALDSQGCLVKGNMDNSGHRWYHLPDFRHYSQVVINLEKGDQWFCTEDEAVEAGFQKARN